MKETGKSCQKEPITVADQTSITGSDWSSKAAAIYIEDVAAVIAVVPSNPAIRNLRTGHRLETLVNCFDWLLNVDAQPCEGPEFRIETHLIAVPPAPPETSKEDGRTRAFGVCFYPLLWTTGRVEVWVREANFLPDWLRKLVVPNTMHERFIHFPASPTSCRWGDISMVEQR